MTVYELIQELSSYPADTRVEIRVKVGNYEAECKICGADTSIDEDVYGATIDEINQDTYRDISICGTH